MEGTELSEPSELAQLLRRPDILDAIDRMQNDPNYGARAGALEGMHPLTVSLVSMCARQVVCPASQDHGYEQQAESRSDGDREYERIMRRRVRGR